MLLLATFFSYIMTIELPELECETFEASFKAFIQKLLEILKGSIQKLGSKLSYSFVDLLKQIIEYSGGDSDNWREIKSEAELIYQSRSVISKNRRGTFMMVSHCCS